jgi:hypothetical protein
MGLQATLTVTASSEATECRDGRLCNIAHIGESSGRNWTGDGTLSYNSSVAFLHTMTAWD